MEKRYENLKKLIEKYNEFKKSNVNSEMSEEATRVWINDFWKYSDGMFMIYRKLFRRKL